jgi:expansin (peptidoglycan-binding protein)
MGRVASAVAAAALVALVVACSSADDGGLTRTNVPEGDAGMDAQASLDAAATSDAAPADGGTFDAGPTYSGDATYYAADGTGACGFPASPNDLMVAAMNKSQYAKSVCGQCVLVVGPKGTVKVRIVDLCPGCSSGSLDLSKEAFALISPLSAGRVKITWNFVPC